MASNGICAWRGKIKDRPRAAPPIRRPEIKDLVQRDFHAEVPDALWFTDLTQVRTGQGWLYAAAILDAFNHEIVSYADADRDTPQTALRALREAIRVRRPPPGCIIHSDRGYQFTSRATGSTLAASSRPQRLNRRTQERSRQRDDGVLVRLLQERGDLSLRIPATRPEARATLFSYVWDYNAPPATLIRWAMSPRFPTQQNQVSVRETRASPTPTTRSPGPRAAAPASRTAPCSADATTERSTVPAGPPPMRAERPGSRARSGGSEVGSRPEPRCRGHNLGSSTDVGTLSGSLPSVHVHDQRADARGDRLHGDLRGKHAAHDHQGGPHPGHGVLQPRPAHARQHGQRGALAVRLQPAAGAGVAAARLQRGGHRVHARLVPAARARSRATPRADGARGGAAPADRDRRDLPCVG